MPIRASAATILPLSPSSERLHAKYTKERQPTKSRNLTGTKPLDKLLAEIHPISSLSVVHSLSYLGSPSLWRPFPLSAPALLIPRLVSSPFPSFSSSLFLSALLHLPPLLLPPAASTSPASPLYPMKLPILRKMNLFRKRDKQKIGSGADGGTRDASQHYLGYDSSSGPSFAVSEATPPANGVDGSRSRSRNFKGLKGFGGSSGRRGATDPVAVAAASVTNASARVLQRFPDTVLARVFAFVCPHSQDRTYEKCEDSSFGECMLCDMRDLAHCVQVCRRWRPVAEQVLCVHPVSKRCLRPPPY